MRVTGPMALRAALCTLVVVAGVELARVGVADFLRLAACAYIDEVQRTGRRPDPARLAVAHDRLALARRIDPGNPVLPEYLGVIAIHRARLVHDDPPLYRAYLERARTHYAEALALRPRSPYLRAGLMTVLAGLLDASESRAGARGESDDGGFAQTLVGAARLADWEAPVLAAVVRLGRQHDAVLSRDERDHVSAAEARLRRLGFAGSP
jgi:hypothetical protein